MTPRLTRRGLFAAGIASVIGTRAASAAPRAVPGLYVEPASTYISPASSHVGNVVLNELTIPQPEVDQLSRSIGQLQEALQEVYGLPPVPGTMVEGQVYCERCDAIAFPKGDRIDTGHIAVRLGHGGPKNPYEVTINGESVTEYTIEAYAGPNGWVIREANPALYPTMLPECPDCLGTLFRLERGDVRVWPVADMATQEV